MTLPNRQAHPGHRRQTRGIPIGGEVREDGHGTLDPLHRGGRLPLRAVLPRAADQCQPGRHFFFEALIRLDYPVVQSVNLIVAALVVGLNLLIDLTYAFLDPRIRYQ